MFAHRHLLGIEGLTRADIEAILDLAEDYVALNRQADKRADALKGLTQINMFFEASTRTQASFELAGKRLGANVMNMSVAQSSVKKGETLIDTAVHRARMHDDRVGLRRRQLLGIEPEAMVIFPHRRDQRPVHPLALQPEHHDDVGAGDPLAQVLEDLDAHPLGSGRHQRRRRDQPDPVLHPPEQQDVRARDAAVGDVAADRHGQPGQPPLAPGPG